MPNVGFVYASPPAGTTSAANTHIYAPSAQRPLPGGSRWSGSSLARSRATEGDVTVLTNLHHADPKFLGGDPAQALTVMTQTEHQALHKDLNAFLENESDAFGNNMRPVRGNSGADIQQNFTRADRLDALARFYSGPGAKYGPAAADFFAQHPGLQP